MQVGKYQRVARTTAIYPASAGVYYPALGLAGEVGEIANKVKKIIRGDVALKDRVDDLLAEIGDVIWYTAAVASDLGIDLEQVAEMAAKEVRMEGDIYSVILKMQAATGRIAQAAEDIRISGVNNNDRNIVFGNLIVVLRATDSLCAILNADLSAVCEANIQKLLNRKEAGTLRGDGDKR